MEAEGRFVDANRQHANASGARSGESGAEDAAPDCSLWLSSPSEKRASAASAMAQTQTPKTNDRLEKDTGVHLSCKPIRVTK